MHVLLTNDDGIDSPGLAALYDRLSAESEVTVVAPATDQSGVGRARSGVGDDRSNTIAIESHEWGYVVDGTPADCVAVGLRRIAEAESIDLVVSGANVGPNVGSYVLGHSGTVGAAVEGAFLGTPGIAVSAYDAAGYFPSEDGFEPIADVTADLLDLAAVTDLFDGRVDLLNANVPVSGASAARLTRPLADYDTAVRADGDAERFESTYWSQTAADGKWVPTLSAHDDVYPAWSDRDAVVAGELSLTPLAAPQTAVDPPAGFLDGLNRVVDSVVVP